MLTSYGIGQYSASGTEAHMAALSRMCRPGGRGIIVAHGRTGLAGGLIGLPGNGTDFSPLTYTLQDLNCPILMPDLAGDAWGNDTSQTRMTSAQSYVQSAFGAKGGKVILIGESMGGLTVLNWARANPTQVAAIALLYPCVNLQSQHDGTNGATAYASSIETAYGGLAAFNAAVATHDPAQNAASYTNAFPIRVYYSTSDTEVGTVNIPNFISAVGGSQIDSVSLGVANHGNITKVPVGALNQWLSSYL